MFTFEKCEYFNNARLARNCAFSCICHESCPFVHVQLNDYVSDLEQQVSELNNEIGFMEDDTSLQDEINDLQSQLDDVEDCYSRDRASLISLCKDLICKLDVSILDDIQLNYSDYSNWQTEIQRYIDSLKEERNKIC